ncbi:DMT family transporter [Glaciimonas immobilis]|uniref:Drug/metabolite transporter (DMT)-like permease n=1 Tax=Glaciimonas immobilis TaxID=728004 RepID=A0A840RNR9_9BURK|nr:DMT family transporter [Glaciimonas immobilis]KAF3997140.1 DMT family transporter [Glaciimonas immobilis]MBB5200007.1 drug/metabolite transporter (DMT)-like permease [Glaciimonas immobilis]
MQTKKYLTGILCCFAATLSWGAMFPVMTDALKYMDPFTFTALRYSIAAIAFIALLIFREGTRALSLKGERWGLAWLFGTAGFAGFGFLVFLGQKLAGSGGALSASIMMATMPMLALCVIWVLKKVRPPFFSFCFILMSFIGVLLVITKGDIHAVLTTPSTYQANIPLIIGALCWVFYTIGASYFPKWSPYRYTAITTVLGLTSVFAVVAILMFVGVIPVTTMAAVSKVAPHLVYMALIAGFVGVLCWNIGNKILTPLNGVLFMDVVPITAFSISSLSGVVPENMQITGACLVAFSLILNNLYQRQIQKNKVLSAPSGEVKLNIPKFAACASK